MTLDRSTLLLGVRDMAPLMVGAVPFGLVTGVSAVALGIPAAEVVLMSAIVFAGAAQLAAISLVGSGAAAWVVLLTVAIINLRHVMYSASLAPWLQRYRLPGRLATAFLLVDQVYTLGILRFPKEREGFGRLEYMLGMGGSLWLVWVAATAAGALVGAQVPPAWQLDFAVPLMFLALLVPAVRTRPALVAALVGAAGALALQPLPYNLGLVSGAFVGIVAGTVAERVLGRADDAASRRSAG